MNKAFVREPDAAPVRCPRCQGLGHEVGPTTLAAWLNLEDRQRLGDHAWFCDDANCPVAYFDEIAVTIPRDHLRQPIPGKDLDAPLCACTGLTREDIEQDVDEGTVTRTKATVLHAQSDQATCVTSSPTGHTCLSAVQGYFVRCQQGRK